MWHLINEKTQKDYPINEIVLTHNIPGNWSANININEDIADGSDLHQNEYFDYNTGKHAFYNLYEDSINLTYKHGLLVAPTNLSNRSLAGSTFNFEIVGGGLLSYICPNSNLAFSTSSKSSSDISLTTILNSLFDNKELNDANGKVELKTSDGIGNFKTNRLIFPNKITYIEILDLITEYIGASYLIDCDNTIYLAGNFGDLFPSNMQQYEFYKDLDGLANLGIGVTSANNYLKSVCHYDPIYGFNTYYPRRTNEYFKEGNSVILNKLIKEDNFIYEDNYKIELTLTDAGIYADKMITAATSAKEDEDSSFIGYIASQVIYSNDRTLIYKKPQILKYQG